MTTASACDVEMISDGLSNFSNTQLHSSRRSSMENPRESQGNWTHLRVHSGLSASKSSARLSGFGMDTRSRGPGRHLHCIRVVATLRDLASK